MIHHVFANRSNVGDWLSVKGIQSLLSLPVKEHLCDEPFIGETLHELSALGPDNFILIGGGGLFMDYFMPFWEGFLKIAERVPFFIWGVGYCDLKKENSHPLPSLIAGITRKSRLCVVRDELTRSLLNSNDQISPPVPCPSIVAVKPTKENGFGLLHVDNYTTAGPDVYEKMCEAAKKFAGRTGRRYRATNNRIPPGSELALSDTLSLYAGSDLVISSALHGCIIALAMGRKVLAVSGDRKIESFMEAAGLKEWVCGIDEMRDLKDCLEALPRQEVPSKFLSRALQENQEVARRVRTLIHSEHLKELFL